MWEIMKTGVKEMPLSPQEQKVLNLIAQSKNDNIALFLMDLLGVA
jgi:hypothetical protein